MAQPHKDMYHNPNLNVKDWWKRIPDSIEYGSTSYETKYSYQICPSCETDPFRHIIEKCMEKGITKFPLVRYNKKITKQQKASIILN
mgnify:CR=1 FL=1